MGVTSADLLLIHENKIIQRYHVKAYTNLIPANRIIQAPTRPVSLSATSLLKNASGKEESKDLEFKSSMLHDKGKSQKSKFLPLELIKAIVSFLNSDGGMIIRRKNQ
jgi:schlafen family protein